MKNRVVITGLGIVSPIGIGKIQFTESLKNGVNGIDKITLFDATDFPSKVGAEVKDFRPKDFMPEKEIKKLGRAAHLAIAAAQLAIEDAKINLDDQTRSRCPVFIGTAVGGMDFAEENFYKIFRMGPSKISAFAGVAVFCASVSSAVSTDLGLHGPSYSFANGCCSSTDAIGNVFNYLRNGFGDIALTGGADACVTGGVLAAFCQMGVVTTKFNDKPRYACKPFHKDRDGFALGEGSWVLILETLERAIKRKALIYAEVVGYSASCDSYHCSRPHPKGQFNIEAINNAFKDANIVSNQIDYISAYGNATKINDPIETKVFKEIFGLKTKQIPCSSIKSMIGHPIGATGAAQVLSSALFFSENFISPTINLDYPDPECDLDYVPNKSRYFKGDYILINTLSFGGKNSCLVTKRFKS